MTNSPKEKFLTPLQKAKQEGQLRSEKIREIVQAAFLQATSEAKEGSSEISSLAKEAIAAVVEVCQDKGIEIKEEVTASIEGILQGLRQKRQPTIAQTQSEIKYLEAARDSQEESLRQEIDTVLEDLHQAEEHQSTGLKSALDSFKDREEVAQLQKRYAELKSQLSIIQANLAQRYGEQSEEVKRHLDEAKIWYEKAKDNSVGVGEKVKQQHQDFEEKLQQAGTSVAQKEREVKQQLKDLWKSIAEIFRDKQSSQK